MAAGVVGLSLGSVLSQALKHRFPFVDPIICGVGLILSAPLLVATTYATTRNTALTYVLLFLGQVTLNLNWAIVCDMLLVRNEKIVTSYNLNVLFIGCGITMFSILYACLSVLLHWVFPLMHSTVRFMLQLISLKINK